MATTNSGRRSPETIAGTLSEILDMALADHPGCDLASDDDCRGERHGIGDASEHGRLRDAVDTVMLLRADANA